MKILSFEKEISSQQAMLRTQGLRGTLIGSFQTFWSAFPWRSTFSSKSPHFFKITNNSGICPHSGGHMLPRGNARGKIIIFSWPCRCIIYSKKRGHAYIDIPWRNRKNLQNPVVGPDLKWPLSFLKIVFFENETKIKYFAKMNFQNLSFVRKVWNKNHFVEKFEKIHFS